MERAEKVFQVFLVVLFVLLLVFQALLAWSPSWARFLNTSLRLEGVPCEELRLFFGPQEDAGRGVQGSAVQRWRRLLDVAGCGLERAGPAGEEESFTRGTVQGE